MSYQKYQTEALVLGGREIGEADKVCTLYTRDFGLVRARASGVRNERSKMRYALQDYGRAEVGLVRGARGWRAAGASAQGMSLNGEGLRAFARVGALVLRLVGGEERNEYLFDALAEAHRALVRASGLEGQTFQTKTVAVSTIEIVAVARVLYALGYLSAEALNTALFTHTAYAFDYLVEAESIREDLLLSINRALSETHL